LKEFLAANLNLSLL